MLRNTVLLNKKSDFVKLLLLKLIITSLFLQYCKTRTVSKLDIIDESLKNNSLRLSKLNNYSGHEGVKRKNKINLDFGQRFKYGMEIKDSNDKIFSLKELEYLLEKNINKPKQFCFKIGSREYVLLDKIGIGFFYNVYRVAPKNYSTEYFALKVPSIFLTTNKYVKNESKLYDKMISNNLEKYTMKSEVLLVNHFKGDFLFDSSIFKRHILIKEYIEGKTVKTIIEETINNTKKVTQALLLMLKLTSEISNIKIINFDPNLGNFVINDLNSEKVNLIDGWPYPFIEPKNVTEVLKVNIGSIINMTNIKQNSFSRTFSSVKYCGNYEKSMKLLSDMYMNISSELLTIKQLFSEKKRGLLYYPKYTSKETKKILGAFWETIDLIFCNTEDFIIKNCNEEVVNYDKIKNLYLENVKKHTK